MSHLKPDNESTTASSAPNPFDDQCSMIVGSKPGVALLSHDKLRVIMRSALPGIVIFVHGVNSDGEWYKEAEQGLCDGINKRLKRCDDHMVHPTPEGGQLTPATYQPELTPDGYISPEMQPDTFMGNDDHFTPVMHFRWGYKASLDELQKYGDSVYLNEENYWGGGPFANGCSALPDLWGLGLADGLFLWMHIQHLNPTGDRDVYSCPPRSYFVLAALRLARLVKSLREKQADVPVTIVCHSQGNMIGMAAAFLGDRMPPAVDGIGVSGRCVADSYVLCNAPYSLAADNFSEDWTERHMTDKHGGSGRQTGAARIATLRAFFDIIRRPASREQNDEEVDNFLANRNHGFDVASDRARYGHGEVPSTRRRVTLYCNPHDQVISAVTVQGIGWRGLSREEIDAAAGKGLFYQRVFAQGEIVGEKMDKKGEKVEVRIYDYWGDHYQQPKPGSHGFWRPESLKAKYSLDKGLEAQRGNTYGQVVTVMMAPFMIVAMKLAGTRINALPDKAWRIPLEARDLPEPFPPQSRRFGKSSDKFDEDYAAPGQWRDALRPRAADEPYAGDRPVTSGTRQDGAKSDAALGNVESESALRYEDHARLRMQARREGLVAKTAEHVDAEDDEKNARADYKAWRGKKIKTYLAENIDTHATDHSTILTNGMHAEKALAYDVAIGMCQMLDGDLHRLRMAADWRFVKGLADDHPHKPFEEYFRTGLANKVSPDTWANTPGGEGFMPDKIVDRREHPAPSVHPSRGGHP